jgi:hypothetical protein
MKRRRRSDDDEVVADGDRVRVPLLMVDGEAVEAWQASYLADCAAAHKLGLDDGFDLHRPGYRFADAAGNEAKAKAYLQAVQDAADAWKHPAGYAP